MHALEDVHGHRGVVLVEVFTAVEVEVMYVGRDNLTTNVRLVRENSWKISAETAWIRSRVDLISAEGTPTSTVCMITTPHLNLDADDCTYI